MKVYVEKEDKLLVLKKDEIKHFKDVKGLLNFLKINPSTVITIKNDEVVLDDETLEDDDNIKILSVISGG
ncbi:MAG: MoaD/ThiS family protein [Candidatus Woesearchaeota archaeon]